MAASVSDLRILEFHPGTACSLQCVFCYRGGADYGGGSRPLSVTRIEHLIDEFAALGGRELFVSGGLEPLSRPEATLAALRCAHARQLRVRLYTNGMATALREPAVRGALVAHADWIRFSKHGISEHVFRKVERPRARNARLKAAIDNFAGLRRWRGTCDRPELGVAFLVVPQNVHELFSAGCFWRDVGADFLDVRVDMTTGLSAMDNVQSVLADFGAQAAVGRFDPLRVSLRDEPAGRAARQPSYCWVPRVKPVVDPWGVVWACCLRAQPGFRPRWARMGDLRLKSLEEILRQVQTRLPLRHCDECTAWERHYNRACETAAPCISAHATT
jgi:hypothetical protein